MNLYDLVLEQYRESLNSFDLADEIKEYLTLDYFPIFFYL